MKQFYILLMILLCGEFARTQTTTTVVSDLQTPSGIAISGNDMYISELGGGRVIKIDHTSMATIYMWQDTEMSKSLT